MNLKKITKLFVIKISRIIFLLIPTELHPKSKLKLKLEENLAEETFNHFKDHLQKSILFDNKFDDRSKIREYAIKTALENDDNRNFFYLEFGVYKGESANFFSRYVDKLYCFDSFQGLKEDWAGTGAMKGTFSLKKKTPKLNSNIKPIIGWVEDTLQTFLEKNNPKINFVHFDMDTYNSTKFSLEKIKPYLTKNCVILFDQFHNFIGWKNGEYKALKESFDLNEIKFKAFSLNGKQCVIQIK